MNHIKRGDIGEISFFFIFIVIYFLNLLFSKTHQNAIIQILKLLKMYLLTTEIIYIVLDIIFIIIILFYFISKIKKYCNQVSLLKNTFKIFETQE